MTSSGLAAQKALVWNPRIDETIHKKHGRQMTPCLPYWISLFSCVALQAPQLISLR